MNKQLMDINTLKQMYHFYFELDLDKPTFKEDGGWTREEVDRMACQTNENIEELEQFFKDFIGYIKEIND